MIVRDNDVCFTLCIGRRIFVLGGVFGAAVGIPSVLYADHIHIG